MYRVMHVQVSQQLLCVSAALIVLCVPANGILELKVEQQPSRIAFGGVEWDTQPVVRLFDPAADAFVPSPFGNNSWVVAELWLPPNRFASLSGGNNGLAESVRGPLGDTAADAVQVAAPLNETGFANFTGISIDLSSVTSYQLNLFVYGQANVRGVTTDGVLVSTGPPYSIALVREPGAADGGRPFRLQPALEVQDAGGNRIVTDSSTVATVSIQSYNSTNNSTRTPVLLGTLEATASRGRIEFVDLGIDAAGLGFVLAFNTNANQVHPLGRALGALGGSNGSTNGSVNSSVAWFDGVAEARSNATSPPFTVGVGPTAALMIGQQPEGARGGEPFDQQPVVTLVDAGGNVNQQDNHSYVTAEIYDNGAFPRRRDASARGLGELGPPVLYTSFQPDPNSTDSEVLASVLQGSVYVNVTGGNPLAFLPPLASGDGVSMGNPVQQDPREGDYLRPPLDQPGAVVRVVRGDEDRFRLDEPWPYNDTILQPMQQVRAAVRVKVVQGVATFTGLKIDRIGRSYTIRFVSSLRPEPQGSLLGRGRKGFGRVGYGYGYGLPDADGTPSLPLAPNGGNAEAALANAGSRQQAAALPNITVISQPFDVALGAPASIVVARQGQGAWAGGQPFRVQPRVEVLDLGGNTVTHDNETVVTVSLASNASGQLLPASEAGVAPSPYSQNELAGLLRGNTSSRVERGVVVFHDLSIDVPGKDFALLFSAQLSGGGGTSRTAGAVQVAPSAEFQVLPFDGQPGDGFGTAVAAGTYYLAVGSPHDSAPVQEVQVLRTEASSTEYVGEVQVVATTAAKQNEVQAVALLTSERGGISAGEFQLLWRGLSSRNIPYDAHADLIKVFLEADFASVGIGDVDVEEVGIDRSVGGTSLSLDDGADVADVFELCSGVSIGNCRADRLWLVTFRHLGGEIPLLEVDNTTITVGGPNATSTVVQVQPSSRIGGSFTLSIGGEFGGVVNTTGPIAFDAHPATVKDAIQAMGTGAVEVTRSPGPMGSDRGSYQWAVTFAASELSPFSYNPPTMVANSSGLTGPQAAAFVHTSRQGESPLQGSFRLFFRGEGPTAAIPFDATAQEMRAALEMLPTIDLLDVQRAGPSLTGGYAWTVTFQLTRTETDEGFELDQGTELTSDLPPIAASEIGASAVPYRWVAPGLAPPAAMLAGTSARVTVDHVYGESRDDPWRAPTRGVAGAGAGSVYVYRRFGKAWYPDGGDGLAPGDVAANEVSRLRPADTDGQDSFGAAVAMDETAGVIAVGAPAAAFYGGLEVQRVTCAADGGTFTLTWRGRETASIPPTASISAVKTALEDLASIHAVEVSGDGTDGGSGPSWSEQPVCGGTATGSNSMLVTFLWPQDGDLPPLEPDSSSLTTSGVDPVVLAVDDDVVRGERVSSGVNATGLNVGAVYLFGRGQSSGGGGGWTETHKLLPPEGHRVAGTDFGSAISASGDTVVVGAPVSEVEFVGASAGAVYVYRRSDLLGGMHSSNTSWSLTQRVVAQTSNSVGGQDHLFGTSVALDGETLVVGAPGASDGMGQVLVFKRKLWISDQFLIDQVLLAPAEALSFGQSVAAADDLLVAGAPRALHPLRLRALLQRSGPLGPEAQAASELRSGAAYVYDREDFYGFYSSSPRSELAPSGAYAGDRAGLSVGVSGHVAVVGSSRMTLDAARPRHEVQVLMLDADSGPMSREWRIRWRRERRSTDPRVPERPRELGVNPADSRWVSRQSRPLSVDATASQVREVLEYDLGTGAVNVTRKGPDTQGGYRWFVTFLALGGDAFGPGASKGPMVGGPVSGSMAAGSGRAAAGRASLSASGPPGALGPLGGGEGGSAGALRAATAAQRHTAVLRGSISEEALPLLEMDVARVRGEGVRGTVARVSTASMPAPGAAFVFARDPATGFGAPWVEAGAYAPHARQRSDYFGRALSVSGPFAAVGAPNRDGVPSGTNSGGALVFDLGLLNLRIDGAGPPPPSQGAGGGSLTALEGYAGLQVDEDGMAMRVRVRHCRPLSACAVPGALAVAREAAAAQPRAGPGTGANETMEVLLDVTAGSDLGHHEHWAREAVLDPSRAFAGLPSVLRASGAIALAPASQGSNAYASDVAAAVRSPATATAGCALWAAGAPEDEAHEACRFLSLPGPLLRSSGPDFSGASDAEPVLRREVLVAVPPDSFNGSVPDPELLDSLLDADNETEALSLYDALVSVRVSDDNVLEAPDEALHVRASLPGFEPSEGGPLWSQATIEDDGDGSHGSRGYLSRVFADEGAGLPPAGADFGRSIDVEGLIMAVGAPRYDPTQDPSNAGQDAGLGLAAIPLSVLNGSDNAVLRANGSEADAFLGAARVDGPGQAYLFRQSAGMWTLEAELSAPNGTEFYTPGARFGAGVTVAPGGSIVGVTSSGGGGAREAIALHVFGRNASGNVTVQLLASLVPDPSAATAYGGSGDPFAQAPGLEALLALGSQGVLPQHGFGLARAVASSRDSDGGYMFAVGCRGVEAVFIFRGVEDDAASWRQTAVLTSSAHRSQRHALRYYFVPEGFGASVAASGSTVVVGAPHANYGGASRVGGDGSSRRQAEEFEAATGFFGTGGVYVFELVLGVGLTDGNATSWSDSADWAGGDALLAGQTGSGAAEFRVINDTGGSLVNSTVNSALWAQQELLVAADGRPGDRLGASVDLDGTQLIAGAWGSGAQPRSTWNFETAGLEGWYATGTAFEQQPTHGDNPSLRPVYTTATGAPGLPQRAGLEGKYFVGTFEARPGDPASPLSSPSGLPGTVQGDAPQGTLTSDPFVIAGRGISLLVGGGCDARVVFVELLVDGDPVRRATGACEEMMSRVHWDVGAYRGRAGTIRIADHSSRKWGHINVDDIRFSWAIQRYGESPRSGVAYAFRREADGDTLEPCTSPGDSRSALQCAWRQQDKLVASDKRAGVQFALDVAVSDAAGVAVVAAARPHGLSSSDWHLPGSIAGVRLGLFGHSEGSARADGGINAVSATGGAVGYGDINVWGGAQAALLAAARADGLSTAEIGSASVGQLSPFLGSVGNSRGGKASVGLQEVDGSGFTGLFGGAGIGGTSGLRFDTRGSRGPPAGVGIADGSGAPFDRGDPYVAVDAATGDAYRMQAEGTFPGSNSRALGAEAAGAALATGVALQGTLSSGLGAGIGGTPAWGRLGSAPPEGLLYVFRREPEKRGGGRGARLVQAPRWTPGTEAARVALPWTHPGDGLGASVAASGFLLAAGTPQDSQLFGGAGSVAVMDSEFTRVGFEDVDFRLDGSRGPRLDTASQSPVSAQLGREFPSYAGKEGDPLGFVVVPVYRYGLEEEIQSTLHVQYSTRDVTAFGVPAWKAAACEGLPASERSRAACGDYVQAEGTLEFAPGQRRRDILVRMVDDDCSEPQAEVLAVHLAVPGGAGLLGHGYTATVRIDDDDKASGVASCARLSDGLGRVDAGELETYPGLYASSIAHASGQ